MAIDINIPRKAFLPCYQHLLEDKSDINFLWGGRDAGRSHFTATMMLLECLRLPYFRCILVKKTFNSIKDAQWQTLKDISTNWGIDHLFKFRESPLGIDCINGNRFLARGCDDVASLKSIKDPTHVWYEELNQLDLTDFITISTTLRSDTTQVRQWGTFNPEARGEFENFWLYKLFFNGKGNSFEDQWVIELPGGETVIYHYRSTHSTYKDNPFCKPQRKAFLEQLAVLNPHYYKVFTEGNWGNESNNNPFAYCFSREKHIGTTTWQRNQETYLSFDFNIDPITCGVNQHYGGWIFGIESIKLDNSDIYKLCDYILLHYPGAIYIVTGDATGRASSALVKDGVNYYTVIRDKLGLTSGQIRVPSVNPPITENRMLVNSALHNGKVLLDGYKCKHLIYDLENVSVTDMGEIDKGNRANPKKRADSLDNFRYYLNTFHIDLLIQ